MWLLKKRCVPSSDTTLRKTIVRGHDRFWGRWASGDKNQFNLFRRHWVFQYFSFNIFFEKKNFSKIIANNNFWKVFSEEINSGNSIRIFLNLFENLPKVFWNLLKLFLVFSKFISKNSLKFVLCYKHISWTCFHYFHWRKSAKIN